MSSPMTLALKPKLEGAALAPLVYWLLIVSGLAGITVLRFGSYGSFVTSDDVVELPALSRATAVKVCTPMVAAVESHTIEKGTAMSSAPRFAPSSLNCTPAIVPAVDEAAALRVVAPDSVDPFVGADSVAVTGDGPAAPMLSDVVKTSTLVEPSVQVRPIWLLLTVR